MVRIAEEPDILTECVFPRILAGMLTPRLNKGVIFYRIRCIIEKLQPPTPTPCSVSTNKDMYYQGETVIITYENAPPNSTLSIGAYPSGIPGRSWTVSGSDSKTYPIPNDAPVGTWYVYLSDTGCSDTKYITVIAMPTPTPTPTPTLTPTPPPKEELTLEVIPDSSITHYVGDTVTLRGTLTQDSEPVSGAPIVVYWWVGTPNYNNVAGTGVTDASGNYNISWIIPQEVLSNSEAIVSLQAVSFE